MRYLLYSTQTTLAHRISKAYYKAFYVYCAEEFDPYTNPGSSSPALLYQHFRLVAERGDRGDPKIIAQKAKLKAVAYNKLLATPPKLTKDQYDAIVWEINNAETRDFAPLVYLIVKSSLKPTQTVKPVPVHLRANPASKETIIEDLIEDQFEVIYTRVLLAGGI
jgi:hypothetical protein